MYGIVSYIMDQVCPAHSLMRPHLAEVLCQVEHREERVLVYRCITPGGIVMDVVNILKTTNE